VYLISKVVGEVVPRVKDMELLVMLPLKPLRHRMQANSLYRVFILPATFEDYYSRSFTRDPAIDFSVPSVLFQ
jgi:hypothetical protein